MHQQALVPPVASGYSVLDPSFQRLYGPGVFNMNALANTVIGSPQGKKNMTSNRFMATGSGKPVHVSLFFAKGIGYSRGNGGRIQISIYPDDGTDQHLPDRRARPLAQATFIPDLPDNREKKGYFNEVRFREDQTPIEAGRLYHLVLENTDPTPGENYLSLNHAVTHQGNGRPARWLNTRDWASLYAYEEASGSGRFRWVDLSSEGSSGNYFSPIMQLSLHTGHSQGVSDMESGSVDPQRVYTATRTTPIRERFKPSEDKDISGFSFAATSSIAGKLKWRILHQNTTLAQGIIHQKAANYKPLKSNTGILLVNMHWYDVALPSKLFFKAGQTYYLELTPLGNSEWKFADHRNGDTFGFTWPAAFTESQAQHLRKGQWIDTYHWNYSRAAKGSNWPVVLHLAPQGAR